MPDPVGTLEATKELVRQGFDVLVYTSEPFAQDVHDVLDLPRCLESEHDRRRSRIFVHQIAAQASDSGAAAVQKAGQLGDQTLDAEQQRLGLVDRRRQLELAVIALRRDE